jgi:hypothetical protein
LANRSAKLGSAKVNKTQESQFEVLLKDVDPLHKRCNLLLLRARAELKENRLQAWAATLEQIAHTAPFIESDFRRIMLLSEIGTELALGGEKEKALGFFDQTWNNYCSYRHRDRDPTLGILAADGFVQCGVISRALDALNDLPEHFRPAMLSVLFKRLCSLGKFTEIELLIEHPSFHSAKNFLSCELILHLRLLGESNSIATLIDRILNLK